MAGRKFGSSQLLAVEDEAHLLSMQASAISMEAGIGSDAVHYDGKAPMDMSGLLAQAREVQNRAARLEGLLAAYQLYYQAYNAREANDDYTGVGTDRQG